MSPYINGYTSQEYDLVVVGSGFAGSIATLNFLEHSKKLGKTAKVALIEAGKEDERCGASRWATAYMRLDKDNKLGPNWANNMNSVSRGLADQDYCKTLEEEVPSTIQYLMGHGVKLIHHEEKSVPLDFGSNQHFVFAKGGGQAVVNALLDEIKKYNNCNIMWETEATKLLTNEQGEMRGVKVRKSDGRLYDVLGGNVMLASGGFQGNPEMLAKYVGKGTADLPLIAPGLKFNCGTGLNMALEVGAGTAGSFDGIHCELVDTRATKPDAVIRGLNYGIIVDKDSQRFYDEGKPHLFATSARVALETWRNHDQKAFLVTDSTITERVRPGWAFDTTDREPEQANTIPELARKLGLDPRELERTVKYFNAACNVNRFDVTKPDGKATTGLKPNKTNWAHPIDSAPYYGYPLTANLAFTYGGLKTDLDGQVLSPTGVPIPGLFAAGELTGFFYHEMYPSATSIQLLRSLTFGRIAGTTIAESL